MDTKAYDVKSSVGHVRDLPVPSKLPLKVKAQDGGAFKKFSVNVQNGFEPYYALMYGKSKVVSELKAALKDADELLLATDEDREGEAIAWHLLEVLKPKVPVKRMVFHEITKEAIQEALNKTREIDSDLVDAQETRRILDRLYGFQISPYLWRKFGTGLSAGRVQSVTTRLVVDREKERIAFTKASYWDIVGIFNHDSDTDLNFDAKMTHFESNQIAVAKDFNDEGILKPSAQKKGVTTLSEDEAKEAAGRLKKASFTVGDIKTKPYTARPKPPFTTSTMQQDAINKLHMSSDSAMRTAQSLYENGYITYMRTDSPNLSSEAIQAARSSATKLYGSSSIPESPRFYAAKSNSAQEAHEAIRPAGSKWISPAELGTKLGSSELALYDLIYKRALASQMVDAKGLTTTLTIEADSGNLALFSVGGTVIQERGFLNAYDDSGSKDGAKRLPELKVGDELNVEDIIADGHETKPPARYTEASLVRKMEEVGIGRPSTYAATIRTIQDRGYVKKRGQALVPTWLAFAVNDVLERSLTQYVDYQFTAQMEEDLDEIAAGKIKRNAWLKDFWFGNSNKKGLEKDTEILKELIESKKSDDIFPIGESGRYQVHITAYGAFFEDLESTPDQDGRLARGYIDEEMAPDEITDEIVAESISKGVGIQNTGRKLGVNPATGFEVVATNGRYGPYFTEILPEGTPTKGKGAVKAKTASLLKDMSLDTVTLDDALKVLQLPIQLGVNPPDGEKIVVNNGRFGPYLMKKDQDTKKYDYRSIKKTETEDAEARMFTITLDEAIDIYSKPKVMRRRKK
jgi:DNA topoisomerase-1